MRAPRKPEPPSSFVRHNRDGSTDYIGVLATKLFQAMQVRACLASPVGIMSTRRLLIGRPGLHRPLVRAGGAPAGHPRAGRLDQGLRADRTRLRGDRLMPNNVLVVDPFAKAVVLHELEPGRSILDQIRDLVGCQLLTTIKPAPQTILWIDNLGLLKGGDAALLAHAGLRRALRRPHRHDRGRPARHADAGRGRHGRLRAQHRLVRGRAHRARLGGTARRDAPGDGALAPRRADGRVCRRPAEGRRPGRRAHRGPGPPSCRWSVGNSRAGYWIVFEDDADDTFHCRERQTNDEGEGDWTGEEARFETLVEVHQFAIERGLKFVLREVKDPAGVAGTMVQP